MPEAGTVPVNGLILYLVFRLKNKIAKEMLYLKYEQDQQKHGP
jgi:hypothetical protein